MEHRDAASVVGARVICWYVTPVTLSRTPSCNGWDNIYTATHQLNLLEPGIVLLVNRVPHFLQICEGNIDIPTACTTLFASGGLQMRARKYPQTLVGADRQCRYEIGCSDGNSRPLALLREYVNNFPRPSSQMLPMHVTTDRCIL